VRRPQCPGIKRKEAEPRDILGLLRPPRKRPRRRRAAEQHDEVATTDASHLIHSGRSAASTIAQSAVIFGLPLGRSANELEIKNLARSATQGHERAIQKGHPPEMVESTCQFHHRVRRFEKELRQLSYGRLAC
jgi:hypothetical protein